MTNWTRRMLTGVMAVAMAAPLAMAGDRRHERGSRDCDDRAVYQGSYYSGYAQPSYPAYGYQDYGYRSGYSDYGYYRDRSAGRSAAIVGGGAAAGAVVGALTGGGKGAAIGAVVGGVGGLVVDQATKNHDRYRYDYRRR
jgi:hypothetical protein